ncbi:LysM peptidoglycan-binding domain-containing protein [Streptomyces microflavus]|uniref:LysM peptidoglycan-binding domain-containing protein n=1 Tax=Streptomyces microflavus TaxID=1919 RepID=UPI00225085E6|nr:LysM peptidoglycan-binding domain-containing protein [Streptomyces microflavus]MCX4657333.1 LysM peptidoglycan-binding domain-containing protein [Streptomyces microflavus]
MSPSPSSRPGPSRRPGGPARRSAATALTLLRALGSLTVLVGLLGGLPVLLWWGTTAVGPDGVRALGNLLSTQDSGQVFLLALAVAGWTGWALFALSVLLEIPAQLRGRTAPQVRILVGQRTAAALVGAVLLALPTGTALAASATPAQASPTVAAASVLSGSQTPDTAAAEASAPRGERSVTHTVADTRPAESLWSIAQERLGDGNRWAEIAELNAGNTMSDGSTFRADGPIQPGWTLRLPADANPAATTPATPAPVAGAAEDEGGLSAQGNRAAAAESGAVYTVAAGDSLSQIAHNELGDADAYPAIFELNKGEAQPGGGRFTDPDLLYPGQELDLPAQAEAPDAGAEVPDKKQPETEPPAVGPGESDPAGEDEAAPPPVPAPAVPAPSASGTPSVAPDTTANPDGAAPVVPDRETSRSTEPVPDRSASPTAKPSVPAQSTPAAPTTPAATHPTPAPAPSADTAAPTTSTSSGVQQVALAAGIGALLAASLAGTLALKRILQQRRRRAGETIAIDTDPTPLEQVLNTQSGPSGVALLDTALRTLALTTQADERELPVLRGARVSDRTVELILDEPAEPLAPFTAGAGTGRWVLDSKAKLLDTETAPDVPEAPYPGLVTLGATENGDLLLADLLHTGTLLLEGTADDVLAVGRAMALEAGTCGWTDHTEIMTVGLGTRLATLLPRGRVRPMPHVSAVVADLGALLLEVHQQADDSGAPEPLPWILICAGDVDTEQAWQLADAVSAARTLPIAIVLPANDATRNAFPTAEPIAAAPGTPVTLPQLSDEAVQLQRLTDEQYHQYVHALKVAEEPAEPATGTWQLAEPHDQTAAAPRPQPHPLLRIQTTGTDASDPGSPYPALLASVGATTPAAPQASQDTPAAETAAEAEAEGAGAEADDAGAGPSAAGSGAGKDEPGTGDSGEESQAPEIAVLGPLAVSGVTTSGHGPKVAALAALIHLRPGRSAEFLCTAMDPVTPWSTRTLQSRLSEIRSRLGTAPDGGPYLPRPTHGYRFHPDVTSDWQRFQHLATRGLADPDAGTADLENALYLLRGKPFEGRDFSWADAVQQEMISRIVDTAHTLAVRHTEGDHPDLDAARRAVLRGLEIDETSEVLYRDWMNIEWGAGNTAGVRKAIARLQQVARTYDISLEPVTEQLIDLVLSDRSEPARSGRN